LLEIIHFSEGGFPALTDLDIKRLFIVDCPKCQKGAWLLTYTRYHENAVHYCGHCDYTFATDLRGELLGQVKWEKRYLEKIHA
jgi:hypothetical protein